VKVFLDTNVLLDLIARREPFVAEAARIWALAETRRIEGLVSALSFTTIYYIARRTRSRADASAAVRLLRDVFTPVACDAPVIDRAIAGGFDDFEDAIQYFSALAAGADCVVTRNPDHFPDSPTPVLVPKEFLATYTVG
jgi:predicted nucleic acid-binding protein